MAYRDLNMQTEDDFMKQSKLNAAGLINLNLENLWKQASYYLQKNNLWSWNRALDAIWLILGGDEPFESPIVKQFSDIEMEIGETGSLIHKAKGFEDISGDESVVMSKQYQLLMKKSLFLRRLQNKQGKGTAYADPFEDDFE